MQPGSLGIDVRDEELERGTDRAELYASNVNRKIEGQWKVYPVCVRGWVGGRGGCVRPANSVT